MRLEDIAKWHRDFQRSCTETASSQWAAFKHGREDSQFEARGWEAMAAKHGEMASVLESMLPAPTHVAP